MDKAGNCMLSKGTICICITGNEPIKKPRKETACFERSASVSNLILRIMLKEKDCRWRIQALSEQARCSVGQVYKVKSFLQSGGFLRVDPDGFSIDHAEMLLQEWARVYNKRQPEPIACYSLNRTDEFEARLKTVEDIYLTGISGGVRYAPAVRYNRVDIYVNAFAVSRVLKQLELKRVDSGANVHVYPVEDDVVLYDSRVIRGSRVVSPVQVFLDCMADKGRGEEEAQAVLRKEILK